MLRCVRTQLVSIPSLGTLVDNNSHGQLEQEPSLQQEHNEGEEGATGLTEPPTTTPSGAPMPTTTDPTLIESWDRCWAVVKATPTDFDAWEELMRLADRQDGGFGPEAPPANISNVRTIYDAFLTQFPLCFGYWKKYSDLEFMARGVEGAVEVQYTPSPTSTFITMCSRRRKRRDSYHWKKCQTTCWNNRSLSVESRASPILLIYGFNIVRL